MYGIIGNPLSHSFSPGYFRKKFATLNLPEQYEMFPLADISELNPLLKNHPDIQGLNVTIPFKVAVLPYLDSLHITAENIGAVNCIRIRNGLRTGFNTDAPAFAQTLQPLLKNHHRRALVLGTGGAAQAVVFALKNLNIPFTLVSRKKADSAISYEELTAAVLAAHTIIINTTPLGMAPLVEQCPPIPYAYLGKEHLLYDLIYNPSQTLFLQRGAAQGAVTQNGYDMLIAQAEASWSIWNS
jgi:shikimate dehydrogenase